MIEAQQRTQEEIGQDWLREKLDKDALWRLGYNNRTHLFIPLPSAHESAYDYGGKWETVPKTPDEPVREGPALMAIDWCGNVVGVGGMLPCVIGQEFTARLREGWDVWGRVERVEMVYMPDDSWAYMLTLERVRK